MSSSAAAIDDEESFEHTLLVVREVSVYKIPPRSTSGGYKCGEWLQSDKIWTGRLRIVSCRDRCEIRLEDPNSGELFAACFVLPGQREGSVETVLDSSRYFVLKIEDGGGKHAFIGLGFNERNEAFDFNVALSDHDKHVRRESEKEAGGEESDESSQIDIHPAVNHRLKEGETIRINVKSKPTTGTGMLSAAGLSPGGSGAKKQIFCSKVHFVYIWTDKSRIVRITQRVEKRVPNGMQTKHTCSTCKVGSCQSTPCSKERKQDNKQCMRCDKLINDECKY